LAQIAALQQLQRSRENRMRVFLSLVMDAYAGVSAAAHHHQKKAMPYPLAMSSSTANAQAEPVKYS
jgi:hypothetical protein